MTSTTATEHLSATLTATKILDWVDSLRNRKVTDSSVDEITTLIRALVNDCNTKYLDLPINVVHKATNIIQTEIKSWYYPGINLANISGYVISTFEDLEKDLYHAQIEKSNRCIDAIQVLIDYYNVVVLSRTGYYLKLQEKKLDELQSSRSVETSIHLVNGDDFHG